MCSYTSTASSGSFTSEGYPGAQQPGNGSIYCITVANDTSIKIDIPVISLTSSASCSYGYLKIYEDKIDSSTLKAVFCGNESKVFYSYSNRVFIDFHAYSLGKNQRFYANYSAVPKGNCTTSLQLATYHYIKLNNMQYIILFLKIETKYIMKSFYFIVLMSKRPVILS